MNEIISCPSCRKPISWKLKKCPHCNYKMADKNFSLPDNPLITLGLMAVGFYLVYLLMKQLGLFNAINP